MSTRKLTINVPGELIEEAKNAYWVDRGEYRHFSEWVTKALERQIQDTKDRHGLSALPPRPWRTLPAGRPLK